MTQSNGTDLSFTSGADLSGAQFTFVKLNASSQIVQAGAGEAALGVLQNAPIAGKVGTVRILGRSKIKLGGTVAGGALGASDAAGKLKAATADSVSGAAVTGSFILGIVDTGGVSGDVGSIVLKSMGSAPTTAG